MNVIVNEILPLYSTFFYEAFQDTFEELQANKSCMNRVIPVMQYLLNSLIKNKIQMNMHVL